MPRENVKNNVLRRGPVDAVIRPEKKIRNRLCSGERMIAASWEHAATATAAVVSLSRDERSIRQQTCVEATLSFERLRGR